MKWPGIFCFGHMHNSKSGGKSCIWHRILDYEAFTAHIFGKGLRDNKSFAEFFFGFFPVITAFCYPLFPGFLFSFRLKTRKSGFLNNFTQHIHFLNFQLKHFSSFYIDVFHTARTINNNITSDCLQIFFLFWISNGLIKLPFFRFLLAFLDFYFLQLKKHLVCAYLILKKAVLTFWVWPVDFLFIFEKCIY